jgi:flagellar assembly protein FliH
MSETASVLRGVPVTAEARALPRPEPRPRKSAQPSGTGADTGSPQRSPSPLAGAIGGQDPGNQPADGNPTNFDRSEIDELRKRAYLEGLEHGRRDGFKEGSERGLAEGRQAGEEDVARQTHAARQAIGALVERLDQMLTMLPHQFEDQYLARLRGSEDDMVALCHSVICRLIGEKAFNRDSVVHCVQAAVTQCRGPNSHAQSTGQLAIHIHPGDLEMLRADAMLSEWLKRHGSGPIPWRADETVRLGGCIVHTERGSLDARLETQLSALHEILLAGRGHPMELNDDALRVAGNEAIP